MPTHPTVAAAHRRVPHLRQDPTGQVLEARIPAIIEQRVPGADAFKSWRVLVSKYGTPAPGPVPAGMRVPPPAEVWRRIPSWEFQRANVDPRRVRTAVACARPAEQARSALTSLPGVGEWTAAETLAAAGLRRRRRTVGRRLPHPEDNRLDAGGVPGRRRADARVARADAATPPPGGAVVGSQRPGLRAAPGRAAADSATPRAMTSWCFRAVPSGIRRKSTATHTKRRSDR